MIDGEQRFAANIIVVQKKLIAFGELLPNSGKPIKQGIPIHTLLVHLDGEQTLFELNDQGNTRDANDVVHVELTPTTFRITFAAGRGPYSGRVSLSPAIEIFDVHTQEPEQLRSLLIELSATKSQLARIGKLLADNKLVRRGPTKATPASRARKRAKVARKRAPVRQRS